MDFSWTDEQLAYYKSVSAFARRELDHSVLDHDQQASFPHVQWLKCAQFGILGLPFPEAYGGSGADILTTVLAMEALGNGCRDNGLIFSLNAQMWSVQMPISSFGTEDQKKKYLHGLCHGALIGAHGMTEPDSGSDAYSLRTRAEVVDGGYLLNGTKMFVTNAPQADLAVVFATTNPERKMFGVTAFIIEKGTPGFRLGSNMHKMGLRSSPMGELVMEDCFVPVENRLGPEGTGAKIFNHSMEWERSGILASHIGAMERQLEDSIHYANERHQFGQAIGRFQSVANRIVDMKVRLETARLLLYKVAWLKKMGKPAAMEAAMAKLYISECFVQSGLDAIRTFGGYGYMTESEVERDLRDAIGGTLYSGTSDIQRNIIARMIGL